MASKKDSIAGTKIKATEKPKKEVGADTDNQFLSNIVAAAQMDKIDISKFEGFTQVSQTRENIYKLIDTMAQDPILASYLKTLAEDVVEPNDAGQIVWCESSDDKVAKYGQYILDSLGVDKHVFAWAFSLIKYGDLYLKLFRNSDIEDADDIFDDKNKDDKEQIKQLNEAREGQEVKEEKKDDLKENVNVVVHSKDDKFVHYVEAVPNPAEMFELTKLGKTQGFVKAPVPSQAPIYSQMENYNAFRYRVDRKDIEVYGALDYVHACLEDNSCRIPEEVDIFINDDKDAVKDEANSASDTSVKSYTVKRGQSELASVFKIWRELSLLENSALLNRITKSSIIRTVEVEVGQMGKEQIATHLNSIKQMMEQKTGLDADNSIQDYTNPGPVENFIYVPTRNGVGKLTTSTVGGDFDPKQLTDISYFQDKLFGSLGVPKAFFGVTDDGAGFNGGTSLAIQSSRYGKSIKRIQNTLCQLFTDLINFYMIDAKLFSYINKFTIRMQSPITQEELDRRENKKNRMQVVGDIMSQIGDFPNQVIKLKVLKSLLSETLTDSEVIGLIQEQIDELEPKKDEDGNPIEEKEPKEPKKKGGARPKPIEPEPVGEPVAEPELALPNEEGGNETEEQGEESFIPSPNDLGIDLTQNQ